MEDEFFKKLTVLVILFALLSLTYLILRPILYSMIIGLILAYIFSPVYGWISKRIKSKNLSASFICAFLILLILIPFWFLTPLVINQSIKLYLAAQQIDFITPLKATFPAFFATDQFSAEVATILQAFIKKMTTYLVDTFSSLVLNFPTLLLQSFVVFFTFFFALRDKDEFVAYIKGLLPFSKEVEVKLFDYSRGITSAVIYGQVVVGIIQGLIIGVGLFIFRVPNSLLLTMVAMLVSILPLLGPYLIWVPVVIYLFLAGNTVSAIGILVFGVIASTIDNILRPAIVSRRTKIHSAIVLTGMIGGLLVFGVLGIILGPLILSYLLIILEFYKNRNVK